MFMNRIKRQLILISNPGNPDCFNYVKTTEKAIDRWQDFFMNPIGGFWQQDEILRFGESKKLAANELRRMIVAALNTGQFDYSLIVFCGHGGTTNDNVGSIQLPIPTEHDNNCISIQDLLGAGYEKVRRTIILDSCRTEMQISSDRLFEGKEYQQIKRIDGLTCSEYYNKLIMETPPHVEILYSTSPKQPASSSPSGSAYTDTMCSIVKRDANSWKMKAIMNDGCYKYSMSDLHRELLKDLTITRQNPDYETFGPGTISFPFAALSLLSTE